MSKADGCGVPGSDILYARPDYYPDGYREDEELYVDEQNCDNCKFGCDHGCPMVIDSYMTAAEKNAAKKMRREDAVMRNGNGAVYDENKETRVIHRRKLEKLEDLIEAANGQPVLIAYWFKHDHSRIMEHLTAAGYEPRDIKESKDIKDWNKGRIPVALIHPASAGHGLNIQQGGHILIWFGLTWSLELYQQANARLWRQGQKQTVTIHHIVTKNTVDEDVLAALAGKDVTQEKLIAAVKARLG